MAGTHYEDIFSGDHEATRRFVPPDENPALPAAWEAPRYDSGYRLPALPPRESGVPQPGMPSLYPEYTREPVAPEPGYTTPTPTDVSTDPCGAVTDRRRGRITEFLANRRLRQAAYAAGCTAVFLLTANHGFEWADSDARNAVVSFFDMTQLPNPFVTPIDDLKNISKIIP